MPRRSNRRRDLRASDPFRGASARGDLAQRRLPNAPRAPVAKPVGDGSARLDRAERLGHRVDAAMVSRAPRRRLQRDIGFEYETAMALEPPRPKDAVIAKGAGFELRVDNAEGQAVVEVVVDHQPETEEGRANAEAALKAVRSDIGLLNTDLFLAAPGSKVKLSTAAGLLPWTEVDEEVNLLPSVEHKTIDKGALQATAGLTLPALAKVLKGDPTLKQGVETKWQDDLTEEISSKIFKEDDKVIGGAAESHADLWTKTKSGIDAFVANTVETKAAETLDDAQKEELTAVAVSMVRTPAIGYSRLAAPQYYKILVGNLLHKTNLATIYGTLSEPIRTFIDLDKAGFVTKLVAIVADISGKDVGADQPVIPARMARAGVQSRSPILGLKVGEWFTGIVDGTDKLTAANYDVDTEWDQHRQVEMMAPHMQRPKGWEKVGGALDSKENMRQRVQQGLEGFGDLGATDAPLVVDGPRRPLFEFRTIGKGTTIGNLPNTALATWDYIALALGKAAGGPETVEEHAELDLPEIPSTDLDGDDGSGDGDGDANAELMKRLAALKF